MPIISSMRNALKKILLFPFHPLVFTFAPVLHLYALNFGEVELSDIRRSLAAAAVLGLVVLVAGFLIFRVKPKAAALWMSFVLILFYSYGQALDALKTYLPWAGRHSVIIAVFAGLLAGATFFLKKQQDAGSLTARVNALAFLWGVILVFKIIPAQAAVPPGVAGNPGASSAYPNIYHIIFDAYSRQDVMKKEYGYDNSRLMEALKTRGFYIADHSRSNYAFTNLSLASLFGMNYLTLPEPGTKPREFYAQIFRENMAVKFLKQRSYRVIVFDSGFPMTNFRAFSDRYMTEPKTMNVFETLLAQTTALRFINEVSFIGGGGDSRALSGFVYEAVRRRIRFMFESLPSAAEGRRPAYVFAHFVSPHDPWVFGPEGEAVTPKLAGGEIFKMRENMKYRDRNVQSYLDQARFMDKRIIETIEEIFLRDPGPKIILLHSDHGGYYLKKDDRMKILNAVYFSDGNYGTLYRSISLVNLFRAVFNRYLDGKYEMLPDDSFWSDIEKPFEIQQVPAETA